VHYLFNSKRTHKIILMASLKDSWLKDQAPSVTAAFLSGALTAIAFNPVDRALYLSARDRRPFLHRANWLDPWQGFRQAAFQRTLNASLWFFLQDNVMPAFRHADDGPLATAAAGLAVGTLNAIIMNPFACVKYRSWNVEGSSFRTTAIAMYKADGVKSFWCGARVTVLRDGTYGVVYEMARHRLYAVIDRLEDPVMRGSFRFGANVLASGAATLASAPLNYARSQTFGAPLSQRSETGVTDSWRLLLAHVRDSSPSRVTQALLFINRLNIGWGTLRVAFGMGFTQSLHDGTKHMLSSWSSVVAS
jgi:hypothetical protein